MGENAKMKYLTKIFGIEYDLNYHHFEHHTTINVFWNSIFVGLQSG